MSDNPDVDTVDYSDERMIQDCLEVVLRSNLPDAILTGWVLQLSYVQPEDLARNATGYQEYAAPQQAYHSALGLATQLKRSIEAWGGPGGPCICD
jgi:hypothetical protein